MFSLITGISLLSLVLPIHAQGNATSTYADPGVPKGTPVPGNYDGALRPRVHFSPPQHFMNDPNGLLLGPDGVYHYYYQYNPTGLGPGNQHWGHATSTDGYTWINQQIAIFPPNNDTYIFSGSAVLDPNNTSGFFPDQDNGIVAIYTLANYPGGVQGIQRQAIAYSRDSGYTFTPYEGNPVLDANSTNFRDPKVLWHAPTQKWAMIVSFAADYTIATYTSPNLKDWTFASNFSHHGLLGIQYECPNLVELPFEGQEDTHWLLYISINPGAPLGGSIGQYFPGTFNGTHFTADDAVTRIADFGKDNYAGQFFSGIPATQPQLSIDWASNWQYTALVPTDTELFRSTATVPRQNHLASVPQVGTLLVQYPFNISSVFASELYSNSSLGNTTLSIPYADLESKALWFEANVTGLTGTTLQGSVNFTASASLSGESVRWGTNVGAEVWMDRSKTIGGNGFGADNPFYTDRFSVSGLYGQQGSWSIAGVLDRTLLELFVNGGQQVGTMVFFPGRELDVLTFGVAGVGANVSVSVGVWGLKDTWEGQRDVNGTVVGNVTMT